MVSEGEFEPDDALDKDEVDVGEFVLVREGDTVFEALPEVVRDVVVEGIAVRFAEGDGLVLGLVLFITTFSSGRTIDAM